MQNPQDEIEALRAKCALLSASLAQAERELDARPQQPAGATAPKPAQTPIEVATAVFGESPSEVLNFITWGEDTLWQLEALLSCIIALSEKEGHRWQINRLAQMGRFVAFDMANSIDCKHEEMREDIKAAGALEGGEA